MLTVITNLILTVIFTFSSVRMPVTNEKQNIQSSTVMTTMENKTENSTLKTVSNSNVLQKQESQTGETQTTSKQLNKSNSEMITSDDIKKKVANEKLFSALSEAVEQSENEVLVNEEVESDEGTQQVAKLNSGEESDIAPIAMTHDSEPDAGIEETESVYKDYRQTFYSVQSGEVKVGYGLSYNDTEIRNINNVMHFYDDEYQEWLPIVAVNINEVLEVGLNERGVPNYYGTILEITYPSGDAQKAIVLDACGACSRDNRIDLWVYEKDYNHDVKGIEYRVIREGFKDEDEQ